MNNLKREEFLNNVVNSDNTRRAYELLFKKLHPTEARLGKELEEFNFDDILEAVKIILGKTLSSTSVKVSCIRKYLRYIGNENIERLTIDHVKELFEEKEKNVRELRYVNREELIKLCQDRLINASDKAIVMLIYNGLWGKVFDEIAKLKIENIKFVRNSNDEVMINDLLIKDDYLVKVLKDAIVEDECCKMAEDEGNDIRELYYPLNMKSEYLIKTRMKSTTNNGLAHYKDGGIKGRIFKVTRAIGIESTELHESWIINEFIKYVEENPNINPTGALFYRFCKDRGIKVGYQEVYALYQKVVAENK